MSGRAIASRFTRSSDAANSARAERRNLRRAGTRANSSSTTTRVPGGTAAGPVAHHRPVVDDATPAVAPRRPALDRQPRHARDRWQRLAAKPQCRDRLDILVGQLRRRMAFQRQRDLRRRHPAAIVRRPRSGPVPPQTARCAIRVAPESTAFSTSSFNALAGLSTTSPAAMRLTRCSGRRRIDMGQSLDQATASRDPQTRPVRWPSPVKRGAATGRCSPNVSCGMMGERGRAGFVRASGRHR